HSLSFSLIRHHPHFYHPRKRGKRDEKRINVDDLFVFICHHSYYRERSRERERERERRKRYRFLNRRQQISTSRTARVHEIPYRQNEKEGAEEKERNKEVSDRE